MRRSDEKRSCYPHQRFRKKMSERLLCVVCALCVCRCARLLDFFAFSIVPCLHCAHQKHLACSWVRAWATGSKKQRRPPSYFLSSFSFFKDANLGNVNVKQFYHIFFSRPSPSMSAIPILLFLELAPTSLEVETAGNGIVCLKGGLFSDNWKGSRKNGRKK